jgi:transcriptional regulator with XRE-family HTH domain
MAVRTIELGDVGEHVAEAVSMLRRRRGWDQRTLAEHVAEAGRSMTASVVGKIEAGTRRVDSDDLVALAVALGVAPARLLLAAGGDPEEPQAPTGEGPIAAAVRDDIEALGELDDLEKPATALAEIALRLAREMDAGGEAGSALHSLAKELRSVLAELRSYVPEEAPDDDGLGDLGEPE